MYRIVAALLFTLASPWAAATTATTDTSDLWWNPNESGWGVNMIQQADTIFATIFVYGASGQASWYVGPSVAYITTNSDGATVFTGPLYQTSGPWFGNAFNPTNVGLRPVGTITFTHKAISSGTLTYTVDGVAVTKDIQRQTWKVNDLNGSYLGSLNGSASGCPANGYFEQGNLLFSVTQTSTTITIVQSGAGLSCTYSGAYAQNGRMSFATGTARCSDGSSGTFAAYELEGTYSGIIGRFNTQFGSCRTDGQIAAVYRGL
jgi:hypothetical protein